MIELLAERFGQAKERSYLVHALLVDLLLGMNKLAPAKVLAVGKAGMSPGMHSIFRGGRERGKSSRGAAGVKAAGNIRRADQGHQLPVVGTALAEVAIKVDLHKLDESESPRQRQQSDRRCLGKSSPAARQESIARRWISHSSVAFLAVAGVPRAAAPRTESLPRAIRSRNRQRKSTPNEPNGMSGTP